MRMFTQVIIEVVLQNTCLLEWWYFYKPSFTLQGSKGDNVQPAWHHRRQVTLGLKQGGSQVEIQYLTPLIVTCIWSTGISTWEAQEDTGSAITVTGLIFSFSLWFCKIWHSGVRCLQRPLCSTPSHRAKDFRLVLLSKSENKQSIDCVPILITSRW